MVNDRVREKRYEKRNTKFWSFIANQWYLKLARPKISFHVAVIMCNRARDADSQQNIAQMR